MTRMYLVAADKEGLAPRNILSTSRPSMTGGILVNAPVASIMINANIRARR
jgi:hypothetical protein